MAAADPLLPLLAGALIVVALVAAAPPSARAAAAASCPYTNLTAANFSADLTMLQHQLRGTVRLAANGTCALELTRFDLLPASPSARFWAAEGPSMADLAAGSAFSPLPLNRTFRNASLELPFDSPLPPLLALYDPDTSSDLGHVFLPNGTASDLESSEAADAAVERAPTMFDNCIPLSETETYRLRWTLNASAGTVEIGLEAAIDSEYYMAFGWTDPKANSPAMIHADVVVTGFTEEGTPFAEDYYISDYTECTLGMDDSPVSGVCPDKVYEDGNNDSTSLVYGHRRDGVSFVRYARKLDSEDAKYDVPVGATEEMAVLWAIGKLRPPDTLRQHYLPQNHGGPKDTTFGFARLNLSEAVDNCIGPLDADNKEDQERIIADRETPLVVTSAPAVRYPNPPNPDKVLYINKKEAPLLKVERGVPVKFSVQAGHDVALYITSDPIGGNATLRNKTEVIYAGGPDTHGVLATPKELVWLPDRNTPDLVYYQSLYEEKMGWKVQVVDGGLSDMYNSSVLLDDQQVTLFWSLSQDSISIAARGEKKSGYLAIGFGSGMVNSYTYVAWVGDDGVGRVKSYWIDGKSAAAELRGFFVTSVHVKFGVVALLLAILQPLNAKFRPSKPAHGEVPSQNRILWEYLHVITGRSAVIVGVVALFTGMKHLGHRYDSENVEELTWALMLWVLSVIVIVLCLEYKEVKRRGSDRSARGHWLLRQPPLRQGPTPSPHLEAGEGQQQLRAGEGSSSDRCPEQQLGVAISAEPGSASTAEEPSPNKVKSSNNRIKSSSNTSKSKTTKAESDDNEPSTRPCPLPRRVLPAPFYAELHHRPGELLLRCRAAPPAGASLSSTAAGKSSGGWRDPQLPHGQAPAPRAGAPHGSRTNAANRIQREKPMAEDNGESRRVGRKKKIRKDKI
nr:unnamed protein product [Digitaria exilis]